MGTRVILDESGRLTIPEDVREAFRLQAGDEFLLEADIFEGILFFAAVHHPLLRRAEEAQAEYEAGLTKSLDQVAAELGITLDRE